MRLQVKGRNVEVSDSIREYAERKLGKLDRLLNDLTTVELVQSLSTDHPVLVVTASHGYEAPYDRKLLGALTDATCKPRMTCPWP